MSSAQKKRIDTTFRNSSLTDSIKKKLKTEENPSSYSSDLDENSEDSSLSPQTTSKEPKSRFLFSRFILNIP